MLLIPPVYLGLRWQRERVWTHHSDISRPNGYAVLENAVPIVDPNQGQVGTPVMEQSARPPSHLTVLLEPILWMIDISDKKGPPVVPVPNAVLLDFYFWGVGGGGGAGGNNGCAECYR